MTYSVVVVGNTVVDSPAVVVSRTSSLSEFNPTPNPTPRPMPTTQKPTALKL